MNKPSIAVLKRLVGNPDLYARQTDEGEWFPVREPLTPAVLADHRRGVITVGTYIVKPPDQARTLVFDFDEPDKDEQNRQITAVQFVLAALDIDAACEFSGKKGYHLWVVVEDYVEAEVLYRIGRGVREECGLPNLEVFPKQTQVRDLGNLVKLPGGVHRVTRQANDFIGDMPTVVSIETIEAAAKKYPEVFVRRKDAPVSIEYPCVNTIQVGFAEGGRNIHLFHLAVMMRKFSLTDENVEAVVRRANQECDPPLDDAELDLLLDNSRFSGPVCEQLSDDVNCGDQCIKAKHQGLFTRRGALKWAADGEEVVVRVVSHTDDGRTVEVEHPDIVQGRAILADAKPPKRRHEESE